MTDSKFKAIELAVLYEIAVRQPDCENALKTQISVARVRSRDNTGAGFFTTIEIDKSAAAPFGGQNPLGNIWVEIEGFTDPITFLLWSEDGYATCLEASAIGDNTLGFDFDAAKFNILPAPKA